MLNKTLKKAISIMIENLDPCPANFLFTKCFKGDTKNCNDDNDQFEDCWITALNKEVEKDEL